MIVFTAAFAAVTVPLVPEVMMALAVPAIPSTALAANAPPWPIAVAALVAPRLVAPLAVAVPTALAANLPISVIALAAAHVIIVSALAATLAPAEIVPTTTLDVPIGPPAIAAILVMIVTGVFVPLSFF